ncbi:MAG: D-sedoheptulose 7-phosphate isomerase [Alphaproteobacteria bacterium]
MTTYFDREFDEHLRVASATRDRLRGDFDRMLAIWLTCIRNGGKILFFGNGGSASDAQHLATELTVRFKNDRKPIAALALTTDSSALTAIGNDYGFERLFARQISALGKPGDVAVGISTSGRSQNILQALSVARKQGLVSTGFSGGDGGDMADVADPLLIVPSKTTARIQEMHITLGQMLCGALELELGLVSE